MKIYGLISLGLIVSAGLLLALISGVEPKPALKIKPNSFERFEEIGVVTYRRMRQETRESEVIVLGSSPWIRGYERIWRGFLLAGEDDQLSTRAFYEQSDLESIAISKAGFDRPEKIDLSKLSRVDDENAFVERMLTETPSALPLEGSMSMGQPGQEKATEAKEVSLDKALRSVTLLHVLFQQSSHFFEQSFSPAMINRNKKHLSITLLPFAVEKENLDAIYPGCDPEEIPSSPLNQLGCASRRASRAYFRKKLDPAKIWALLEQHGQRDLLLFVYIPQ